jgi:hypothetical protein
MEAELRALAHDLDAELGELDLSTAVTRQLATPPSPTRLRQRSRRRRLAVALVAAIAITATAATPAARKGVTNFLDIGTVRVHDKPPPGPVSPTANLQLGDRTTLDAVRSRMPVVVPTVAGVRTPDEVWFGGGAGGGVSLVYRARPGLPAAAHSGVGLLVQEFAGDARGFLNKYLRSDSRAQAVTIGSDEGVFLSGGPHYLFYDDPTGNQVIAEGRLVGNALIFQQGPLTIRLEGDLPLDRMVAIAASLR